MTTTYIGFYRPVSRELIGTTQRESGTFPADLAERIGSFPDLLPDTCKLIGSWRPTGGQVPGVMVIEAESFADVQHVDKHYFGWLEFDWHPVQGSPRDT